MFSMIKHSLLLLQLVLSLGRAAVPSHTVPSCISRAGDEAPNDGSPYARANLTYDIALDGSPFPKTEVLLCWTNGALLIRFGALNETSFAFDPAHKTNDPLYEYSVMEAFISAGTSDPQTYLEVEVSPNNVTYTALVYNPSKRRAEGSPFDHFFINEPKQDGFLAKTEINKEEHWWYSIVQVPLALFNVVPGQVKGTRWRMNFFRTVMTGNGTEQRYGAWSRSNETDNFHVTDAFGEIELV